MASLWQEDPDDDAGYSNPSTKRVVWIGVLVAMAILVAGTVTGVLLAGSDRDDSLLLEEDDSVPRVIVSNLCSPRHLTVHRERLCGGEWHWTWLYSIGPGNVAYLPAEPWIRVHCVLRINWTRLCV